MKTEQLRDRIKKAVEKATNLDTGEVKKTVDEIEYEIRDEWNQLEEQWKNRDPKLMKWVYAGGGAVAGAIAMAIVFAF
jgi:malate synthase